MKTQFKKGFTLVELIVVIAIIAILSTVSVVGYSAFMTNANQSKVDQELAQVENILMAEAIEGIVIDSTSMTLEGTTLVFDLTLPMVNQEEFTALLAAAGVDASMIANMTLVHEGTAQAAVSEAHILYQIGTEYSYIIVEIV